jgi:hypothetical protein
LQACNASYKYYADPTNPYVYAHPFEDVVTIARRIKDVSRIHPDGCNMYIQIICPENDYWPLPWYLRSFHGVAYQSKVDEDMPSAPVIIASASIEPTLMRKLYELPPPGKKPLYVPLFDTYMWLRPQIELCGYITEDLWDRYRQSRTQPVKPQHKPTGER